MPQRATPRQRPKNEQNAHLDPTVSSETETGDSGLLMVRPPSPLSPPRPFFVAGGESNRGSLSSLESAEPASASDSDREVLPKSTLQAARTTATPVKAPTPMPPVIPLNRATTAPRRRTRSSQGSLMSFLCPSNRKRRHRSRILQFR